MKRLCYNFQYCPNIYVALLRKSLESFGLEMIINGKFALGTMKIAGGKVNGSEILQCLICEFLMAGNNSPDFCWEVTVCNLIHMYPRFGTVWCFRVHLKAKCL
jgi:hypothetical protein